MLFAIARKLIVLERANDFRLSVMYMSESAMTPDMMHVFTAKINLLFKIRLLPLTVQYSRIFSGTQSKIRRKDLGKEASFVL